MPNQKLKHIKQIDNNCHILDLAQVVYYVENGDFIASYTTDLYDSRIKFYNNENDVSTKQANKSCVNKTNRHNAVLIC